MLVRNFSIGIIITMILIEIYLCVCKTRKKEQFNEKDFNNAISITYLSNENNIWDKIEKNKDDSFTFHININFNFNTDIFLNWIDLIDNLTFDMNTKTLKIQSKDDCRALAIINLIISNMKELISFDEIKNKDLINTSIIKCRKYPSIVKNKLIELILENNTENNEKFINNKTNIVTDNQNTSDKNIPDTNTSDKNIPDTNTPDKKIKEYKIKPYEGTLYSGF